MNKQDVRKLKSIGWALIITDDLATPAIVTDIALEPRSHLDSPITDADALCAFCDEIELPYADNRASRWGDPWAH